MTGTVIDYFLNSSSVVIQAVRLLIYTYTTELASAPCGSRRDCGGDSLE